MKKSINIKKMTMTALFLAIALLLPSIFPPVSIVGKWFSPMHLPVFLCGFVCGWPWGLLVGFIAPLLRNLIFGMPQLITAVGMAFELGVYGLASGLLYKLLPKNIGFTYVALILAMILGRCAAVCAKLVIYGMQDKPFVFAAYLSESVLVCWPGIVLQLVIIPVAIAALKKVKLILNR